VVVWLLSGTSVVSGGSPGSKTSKWTIVETGDFNGDGITDILWRADAGDAEIWLMNGLTPLLKATPGNVSTDWTIQGINAD
jgi:hypothetical protein